jgi:hypothetical protein
MNKPLKNIQLGLPVCTVIGILRITTPTEVKTVTLRTKLDPLPLTQILELDMNNKSEIISIREIVQKIRLQNEKNKTNSVEELTTDVPVKKNESEQRPSSIKLKEVRRREIFLAYQKESSYQLSESSTMDEGGLLIDTYLGSEESEERTVSHEGQEESKHHSHKKIKKTA